MANLPVSCLCSVYKNIKTRDLIKSLKSLYNQNLRPKDIVIIIDGFCKKKNVDFINIVRVTLT